MRVRWDFPHTAESLPILRVYKGARTCVCVECVGCVRPNYTKKTNLANKRLAFFSDYELITISYLDQTSPKFLFTPFT
jgi:hypothetical protein